MSFFISICLLIAGFTPLFLVLSKHNLINFNFLKPLLETKKLLTINWKFSSTVALLFTLIVSPSMNLFANSPDLVIAKIQKDIESSISSQSSNSSTTATSLEASSSSSANSVKRSSANQSSALSSSSMISSNSSLSSLTSSFTNSSSAISQSSTTDKELIENKTEQVDGSVKVTFPAGTEISFDDSKKTEIKTETREKEKQAKKVIIEKAEKNETKIVTENKEIKKNTNDKKNDNKISEFDLGFTDEHLIFSKPVKLEVAVNTESKTVTIQSKHFGDTVFAASGLGLSETTCTNSGTALTAPVIDNKVTFYTCGASTFTVTPSTGLLTITSPTTGATVNQFPTFAGTGTTGATVNLTLDGAGTNYGTTTVVAGAWSISPNTPLPLGSNTICSSVGVCVTVTVVIPVLPYNTTASPRTFATVDPTVFSTGSISTDVNKTATIYNMSLPETKTSGGQYHNCAIDKANKLKCWGYQPFGTLGIGSTTQTNIPTLVSGITEDVYGVDAAIYNTCAIGFSGKVYCAGYGVEGQIGDGANVQRNNFVQVSGITDAVSIAVGERHACAALASGGIKCWGQNAYNQLGNGNVTNTNTPGFVTGTNIKKYLKVVANTASSCALDENNAVTCWGYNGEGQIGDGTNTQRPIPVQVTGLDKGIKNIYSSEGRFFCGVVFDGSVACWGQATGSNGATNSNVPVTVIGLSNIKTMALGENHACAVDFAGLLKCFNYNDYGKSQGIVAGNSWTPITPAGLASANVVDVSATDVGTCFTLVDGSMKCWGYNGSGQVGDGTVTTTYSPVAVSTMGAGQTTIPSSASNLNITNLALSGADASNFTITGGTCQPTTKVLVSSANCTVNMKFNSPIFASKNALLGVTTNAINISNVNLSGSVVTAPGGVTGSVLWTRTDDSSCVVATNCAAWKDNSGNVNPVETAGTMQLQPGDKDHNYQPWFTGFSAINHFSDNSGSIAPNNVNTVSNNTVFGAVKPNSNTAQGRLVGTDDENDPVKYIAEPGYGLQDGSASYYRYWNLDQTKNTPFKVSGGNGTVLSWNANETAIVGGINGKLDTQTLNTSNRMWGDHVAIGYGSFPSTVAGNGGAFAGDIQEVIWYNNTLSANERLRVESYLAAKTGATLDQTTPTNYIASNTTSKMWDATTAGTTYNKNISIIGRDDSGTLNQKQSIPATNSTERISIARNTLATNNAANVNTFSLDNSFLASSDNNLTGTAILDTAACPGPTSSTVRTNRVFQIQASNYNEKTTIAADWLGSYFNPTGRMFMLVADNDTFTTNRETIAMVKNGTNWEAPYAFNSTKYVSFVGETYPSANLMSGDKEINWLKTPWNGGAYLPGVLGWGPGTMTQTQGDTNFTMKWSDPANTNYAQSIWSGYPAYYPLTVGDKVQWVGLDKGTPDAVTFEISGNKAAKSASFMIHGIDSYYYNDSVKVEGFLGATPVTPKLTDYSGILDSVSASGNTATGTGYYGNRWTPWGDVKVNFNSPVDKILVTYKPTATLSPTGLWWQEFAIGNIKFKGGQPAPTYTPADGILMFKEVSPAIVELGQEQTVDFTIQNLNCANKTINFSDILPNGTYVKDTLIGAPAGTLNAFADTNTLGITSAVIPAGITNMSIKIKAGAVGSYLNQATFNVGATNYTSDLESTATANDASPYNVIASTKQTANFSLTKAADVSQVLQNGIVKYTYTIVNNGTTSVPLVDISDTLSGAQKYIPGTLTTTLTGGNVIGNNGATPPAETYGNGNILSLKGFTIPTGTTTITIQANVNNEPIGNILKNKFDLTVLDPAFQSYHKESNETSVNVVSVIAPPTATLNQASTQLDPTTNPAINFTVLFSQAINPTTFTAADVTLTGTGTATVGTPTTTDNITWTVPVNATAPGTIIANIGINKFADVAGNTNTAAATFTDNTVTYTVLVTPTITIVANQGYNAGITGLVGDSYCNIIGDISGAPGCLTTTTLTGQNLAYNIYNVVISTSNQVGTSNQAFAYSTDNVCNASDTWVPSGFNSYGAIDSTLLITNEIHNGQYICTRQDFGGVTSYQVSSWTIKIDRTDPVVTIVDNGNTTPAQTDVIKTTVTDAGGNVPTDAFYKLVASAAECTDIAKPYAGTEYSPFPGVGYTTFDIASGITFTNQADSGKYVCIQTKDTTEVYTANYGSYGFIQDYNFAKTLSTPLNIDTTPPTAPTVNPSNGFTLSGTGEAGSTITVKDSTGTVVPCTPTPTIVAANGSWSCTPTTPPANGAVLSVTSTDPAGNVSLPATVTIDNVPPTAPVVNPITPTTNPIIGAGTAGDVITVTKTDPVTGVVTPIVCTPSPVIVAANGTWSCTMAAPLPAPTIVKVTETDPAGNTSAPTTVTVANAVIPDTIAPSAPTINLIKNNDIAVTGLGEPGSTVTLTKKDPVTGVVTPIVCSNAPVVAAANGIYSCTLATPLPTNTVVQSTVTDPAGNVSAPSATTVSDAIATNLFTGTQSTAPTVNPTNNADVVVTGSSTPGATVTVSGATCINTPVIVPVSGIWTCNLAAPLATGSVVTATATEPNKTPSVPATTTVSNALTTSPAAPVVAPTNGSPIGGTATPGDVIKVTDPAGNPVCIPNPVVAANGSWSCTPATTPANGTPIIVIAIDPQGNVSPATTVVVDSIPPSAPVVNSTNGSPIQGTGTPGDVINIKDPAGIPVVCIPNPVVVLSNGTFSCTPATTPTGPLTVIETDPSGNPSTPTVVVLDVTVPTTPTVNPTNGTTLAGTGEAGSTIVVKDPTGAVVPCTPSPTIVAANGTWSCTPTTPIAIGTILTITSKDVAGNVSAPATVSVDNVPPAAPTCTATPNPSNGTTAVVVNCTGVESGTNVTLPGTTCVPTPATATGIVVCTETTPGTLLSNPTVTVKDPAGNTTTAIIPYIKDTTPPTAATLNPQTTNDTTPTLTGNGTPGDKVTIKDAAGNLIPGCVDVVIPVGGVWTCTPINPLPTGANTLKPTTTDPAGNVTVGTAVVITIDTSVPNVTVEQKVGQLDPTFANEIKYTITFSKAIDSASFTISDITLALTNPGIPSPTATITALTQISATVWEATVQGMPNHTTVKATIASNKVVDTAGNVNPASTSVDNTVLYEVPAPNVNALISNSANPTLTGECVAGHNMEIRVNPSTLVNTVICDGTGHYSLPLTGVPDGTYDIIVKDLTALPTVLTNPVANQTAALTIDSVKPTTPTVNPSNGSTLSGTGEVGSTVIVKDSTGAIVPCTPSPTIVAANGSWTCTPTTPVANGAVLTVTSTDPAGNVSAPATVTIDTIPPTAPVVNPTNGSLIAGTGTPGDTIKITDPAGNPVCTPNPIVTANGTWSCTPVTTPTSGPLSVTETDASGNVSTPTSVVLDTTPPTSPTVNPITPTTNPITGTGTAGDVITVTKTDPVTGVVTPIACTPNPVIVATDGSWSCTMAAPLPAPTVVKVTETDPAGNITDPITVTVASTVIPDTIAPSAPTVNPVDDNDIVVTGNAEPGSTIKLTNGLGNPIACTNAPVIAAANGSYSCTLAAPLTTGSTIKATATDQTGNVSAPVATTVTDNVVTNPTTGTQSTTPTVNPINNVDVVVTGTGTPGATVTVTGATCTNAPVVVSASGIWTCNLASPLSTGSVVSATQATPGKTPSAPSATTVSNALTSTPAAPVVNPTNGSPISGTGTPGDIIKVTDPAGNPVCTPSPVVAANGSWSCVPATTPANGTAITVTATDPQGNPSGPTKVVVDTIPPVAPVVTLVDNKPLSSINLTPDSTPTIKGTGIPGDTINIKNSAGVLIGTTTVLPDGTWSITPTSPLPQGNNNLSVTAIDPAGNISSPTAIIVNVDNLPPVAPTCTTTPNPSNGTIALTVKCIGVELGTTITLPGTTCTPTPATSTGIVNCVETIPGTVPNNPTLTITDPTGNSLPVIVPYVKDITPPVTPTCTTAINNTVTCNGVTPGDIVTLPGTTCIPTPASSTGIVVCTPTNPTVTPTGPATTIDPAGNTIAAPIAAPGVVGTPSVGTVDNKPVSSTTPTPTNNTTPTITGTGTPGDIIKVVDQNANIICIVTVQPNGTWSCTSTTPLAQGNYNLTAIASNPVSNITSTPSTIAKVVIDTAAPLAPIIISPITGTTTTNPLPTFTGTGEAGAKVTIKDEFGNVQCATIVAANVSWTCPFTVPQTEGTHTYTVSQTDLAGNSSANSTPVIITFDIDTDTAPTAVENAAPNNGDNNGDGLMDSTQGNIATKPNTANANLYTSLDMGTTGCNAINNFDFTPEAPLSAQDANYDYPVGLFIFKVKCATPGQTLNVTFVLDKIYNTSTWVYRKFNTVTSTYVTMPGVVYGTKLVGTKNVTTISFSVVEGGPFDEDGIANGVFSDPSGPSVAVAPTNSANGGGVITIITNSSNSNSLSSNSSINNQTSTTNSGNNNPANESQDANGNNNPANNSNNLITPKDSVSNQTSDSNKSSNPIQSAIDMVLPRTGGEDIGTFSIGLILSLLGLALGLTTLRKSKKDL